MTEVVINVTDAHDNNYELKGDGLTISVEGVTTLILKPKGSGDRNADQGMEIVGSFINVASVVKELD